MKTNPNAIKTIQRNTIFTNVAETSDGGVYWEGIDQPLAAGVKVTSWKNKDWTPEDGEPAGGPAAPNPIGVLRVCSGHSGASLLCLL